MTGVPLEPRAALGAFDPATGRYTIHAGSGGAVRQKREIAAVLGVAPDKVRVLSHDVGGNFGTRNRLYVEFGLVAWAARRIGRPVKLRIERAEAFLADYQGRDLVTDVALALDGDGRFLAMRASNLGNVGGALRFAVAAVEGRGDPHRLLPHPGGPGCARARSFPTPRRPTPTAAPGGPR